MASNPGPHEAWIRVVGIPEALAEGGALAHAYATMQAAGGERPSVYSTPTGDAPNIVRCHGLDPEGLRLAFTVSTALHWSEGALPWRLREMVNTVTSRANECFY